MHKSLDSTSFRTTLCRGSEVYGIVLDNTALDRFDKYIDILTEYNLRTNLVSKGDMSRFLEYHILDSLKIASCLDMKIVTAMMDFGSGAGLPGIPLSIAFPEIETVLVESRKKRCDFLVSAVEHLCLANTKVLQSRIESLDEDFNGSFDLVITRATLKLDKFFRSARRFITHSGSLVSIKGDDIKDEVISLNNAVNSNLFNIDISIPKEVLNVRTGKVVVISSM